MAVLAGALWLREPAVRYLVVALVATAVAAVLVPWTRRSGRRWAALFLAIAAAFGGLAGAAQWTLARIDRDWEAYGAEARARGTADLARRIGDEQRALATMARRALDAPADPHLALRALAPLAEGPAERAVVVLDRGLPLAWSGTARVRIDRVRDGADLVVSPFYVVLTVAETRGDRRAVAASLLHAVPPADRLARPLDALAARSGGARAFEYRALHAAPDSLERPWYRIALREGEAIAARPAALSEGETRLRVVERARFRGAALLALALAIIVGAVWRATRRLALRFAALGLALACVAIVPLTAFSNASRLFDPALYFAPLGRWFTSSIAALGLTSGTLLLGLLAVLRARLARPPRWVAIGVVVLVAGLGPFLLRDLSRGITPPSQGVTTGLWLGWQTTLFLAAAALLLSGASAGRMLLGARRGLPAWLAPVLAMLAALLAPVVWQAPGRWPGWYPVLWIVVIAALALARRHRLGVFSAAAVAALGATTLVWGATARQRVGLATADVRRLATPAEDARALLERFARDLDARPPEQSREALLERYVTSDLAPAGFPVQLSTWHDGAQTARLVVSEFPLDDGAIARTLDDALRTGRTVLRAVPGYPGVQQLLAVPHGGEAATLVVVGPETRLIPDDPYAALLGAGQEPGGEPPYVLTLVPADPPAVADPPEERWVRIGNALRGEWIVPTSRGPVHAHAEVELRDLGALIQRGALVLLLDLAIVAALSALILLADGTLRRWIRARRRLWARSYRTRLTVALFTFFMVPAIAFAIWSSRRLQADDRQYRELLVREELRALAEGETLLPGESGLRSDVPVFVFEHGEMRQTSDPLFRQLAPVGRYLPPDVYRELALGDEVMTSRIERLGDAPTLFGYRLASGIAGERLVFATPAAGPDVDLDRRRRDLGILVLFATAIGAFATLLLSGAAARELARPIGTLRRAALAIAAGEREPLLVERPPAEFVPVFSAFRSMAADLAASREALEEAQRRTAAILRNVASGVVAVSPEGRVTLANPRADALLGVKLPPGTPIAAIGSPTVEEQIARFLASGADEEEFDLEHEGRQMHGRLTRLARGGTGAVLTLDDVTELGRAQRVLAWGEMARQIAHEIKNPLTPIRLGVQHLRRARSDPRVDFDAVLRQNVERILAEIDRLDEIARSFSRYGMAPEERAPGEPVDVAAIVRDVVELERMGHGGGVDWDVAVDEPVGRALARPDELREVLLNVLENARLARASAVAVRVGRENGRVVVRVRDDGEGIPAEVLPRIFEPHFSTRTSGSGLGLAISRRLVEGWGGGLAVTSERGVGTEVEIGLVGE
ncbi:MAG TPA: ATP-binding protein [Gemmatimonadaceae bacterium]